MNDSAIVVTCDPVSISALHGVPSISMSVTLAPPTSLDGPLLCTVSQPNTRPPVLAGFRFPVVAS